MTAGEQARWWGLAGLALLAFLWAFSSAVAPFLAGMALAYFLDPLADRLERLGASRVAAASIITALIIGVAVGAMLIVIPLLVDQLVQLVRATPGFITSIQHLIEDLGQTYAPDAFQAGDPLIEAFNTVERRVQEWSLSLLEGAFSSGLALFDVLTLVVITPIVTFYLLLDWDRMIGEIDHWLPRHAAEEIRRIATQVDVVLAGFVRGQVAVMIILGVFYAVSLALVGLPFGVVVGMFAGLVSFIPFVGSITGGALSIGIALVHFWGDWGWIIAVVAIFLVGQAVEGNVLTPLLVGNSVGLHPVWLMFALAAFGSAMGFVGLLIAVPAAAVIGVLARVGLQHYREGRLYLGGQAVLPDDPEHTRDGAHPHRHEP
jgi:predicted PurR-regulated permease PerM